MAVKTDKKAENKTQKNVRMPPRHKGAVYQGEIRPIVMQVLVLRNLGWSIPATAQACSVGERSVYEWCRKHKDTFAELPSIQAAKDAIQCLIPKAVSVYKKSLEDTTKLGFVSALAADIATKVLISNKVVADRKVIEDEREQSTGKLVDEAERILAGVSNPSTRRSQAQSNTDDTPGA